MSKGLISSAFTSSDEVWLDTCQFLSDRLSHCPRRKFAAMIVNEDNQVISIGYNGNIRGQLGDLCGSIHCERDVQEIPSGKQTDIGCIHAEENAILNCARQGISCKGSTLYVNGEPCLKCSARIVQSGIQKLVYTPSDYSIDGLLMLKSHDILVVKDKRCET